MPYVRRTVQAGPVRETKKMMTGRIHTKGARRAPKQAPTTEEQKKINERVTEERLRWKINANFRRGDLHIVLHHIVKGLPVMDYIAMRGAFLRILRDECKRQGIPLRYIACTETKRLTNVHHHILIGKMDTDLIVTAWEKATKGAGRVSFSVMDNRGNHGDLANYLIKETRSTVRRYEELGRKCKRFSCSKGLVMPEPKYEVIQATRWRDEVKPRKGWVLFKFEDGETVRTGWHKNGYPFQEFWEIDYNSA